MILRCRAFRKWAAMARGALHHLLWVSERPQIEASAFLQLDEDPVEAGGMAIEPTGVLQPFARSTGIGPRPSASAAADRSAAISSAKAATAALASRVLTGGGHAMLTSTPTIAPTTVSTTRPEPIDSAPAA